MADTHSVIGTKNKKGQTFTDTWKMMNEAPRTPSFYTGSEVIKEALRRASCEENRSLSNQIESILAQWLGSRPVSEQVPTTPGRFVGKFSREETYADD